MIRAAARTDIAAIKEWLREFRAESAIAHLQSADDDAHVEQLLMTILAGRGVALVAPDAGMILGLVVPSVWCPDTLVLHELAWYVTPAKRQTTAGYRLLAAYLKTAQDMKQAGRIAAFTLSRLATTPIKAYEKLGLQRMDETWVG